jgi:hypothetical protein
MNTTAGYYKLYFKTLCTLVLSLGWREILIALFSLPIGAGYYLATRGWKAMVDQTTNFVVFTLAPLVFLALVFFLKKLIDTPVKIYTDLSIEASNHSWKDISIVPRLHPEDIEYGVILEVINNKPVPLKHVELIVISVSKEREDLYGKRNMSLFWLDDSKVSSKPIMMNVPAKERAFAAFANWTNNKAYLQVLWQGDTPKSQEIERDKEYIITIELQGSPSGHHLDNGPELVVRLVYDGNAVSVEKIDTLRIVND